MEDKRKEEKRTKLLISCKPSHTGGITQERRFGEDVANVQHLRGQSM